MTTATYDLANMIGAKRLARGNWWTKGRAWSLVEGCSPVSEGCAHCWARQASHMRACQKSLAMQRRHGGLTDENGQWTGRVRLQEQDLYKPTPRQRPAVWSVWNDLFHRDVSYEFVDRAWAAMFLCPQHVFLILTKRPERMREYLDNRIETPNLAIGVTVESAKRLDRIRTLNQIAAAMKFVSFEPLLGPIRNAFCEAEELITPEVREAGFPCGQQPCNNDRHWVWGGGAGTRCCGFDWAIIGCESGGKRRECRIEWVRDLKEQMERLGVPVLVKQLQVGPNRKVIHDMNDPRWLDDLKLRQTPAMPMPG